MIVDMNHDSYYGPYIQTIEAVGGGVEYGFLDDQRMVDCRIKILRVVGANEYVVSDAISFMASQLGKDYYLPIIPKLDTGSNTLAWYCSELVYAAYLYAGIDIGIKYSSESGYSYVIFWCFPVDIFESVNTYEIFTVTFDYLDMSIVSKSGSTWTIEIFNPCSFGLYCLYNKKMCLENDAVEWTNLSDTTSFYVDSNSRIYVEIRENWFATCIVCSYITSNCRIITYCDELNASSLTLYAHHNIKRV